MIADQRVAAHRGKNGREYGVSTKKPFRVPQNLNR
jgi:hypothetical protein